MSGNDNSSILTITGDRSGHILEALKSELPPEHFDLLGLDNQPKIQAPILHGTHFDIGKANDLIYRLEASQLLFGQASASAVLNVMSAQGIIIGENYLIQMIKEGYASQVKSLIKFGLDFSSAKDVYQHNTALHTAVALEDLEIFNALLASYQANILMSKSALCQSLLKKNKNNDSVLNLAAIRLNAKPGVRAELLGLRKGKALFLELAAILLPDYKQAVQEAINNIPHAKTKQEVQAKLVQALSEKSEAEIKQSKKNKAKNKKKRERLKQGRMLAVISSQHSQADTGGMDGLDDQMDQKDRKDQEKQSEPKEQEYAHTKLVTDKQSETQLQVSSDFVSEVDLEAKKVTASKSASKVRPAPQSQLKVEAQVTRNDLKLSHNKPGNIKPSDTKLSNAKETIIVQPEANYVVITGAELDYGDDSDEVFEVVTRKKSNKDKSSAAKPGTAKKTNGHTAQSYRSGNNRPGNRPQNGQAQPHATGKVSGKKNGVTQAASKPDQKKLTSEEIAPTESSPEVQHTIAPWASLMKKPAIKVDSVADQSQKALSKKSSNESTVAKNKPKKESVKPQIHQEVQPEAQKEISAELPAHMRGTLLSLATVKEMQELEKKGIPTGVGEYVDSGRGFFILPDKVAAEQDTLIGRAIKTPGMR